MEQEKLGCSICLNLLKDPVTIPCGHSYCMNCIRSYWDEEDQKETHSCPQCRQTFRPRPDLVRNTVMADLVEEVKKTRPKAASIDLCYAGPGDVSCDFCTGRKLKAVKSCLQCLVSYCDQHLQPHYQSPAFKKHKLVNPSRKLEENICSRHDKMMEIFCRTDQQCICYLCSLDEHRGHDTVSAAAERNDKQRELAENREKIQQRIREKEEGMKVLQQEMAELRRRSSELELLSQTDDHIQFLQNYTLLGRLSEATDSAVSDATDKPQDVLREESTESSQMNAEVGVLLSQADRKIRDKLLKYSCQTTLDPNTAHYCIKVEDRFRATFNFTTKPLGRDHPDRFTDWYQVLCRESTADSCYWEVEWEGSSVFIAVSSKSISRAGAESAFGSNDKSWSLQCFSDGYEFRHNNSRTPVSGPPSSRIGVCLDQSVVGNGYGGTYKKRTLSFYSITDAMTLLHKVNICYDWQVCLGFGLYDGSSAEICKLSNT
ncbi:tripartite motif-containing protein 16-like [Acanthochromis polyacanthus]|uniref:tripartite motif-containing protein 16-like n=1 Tax=Acanthochromis polyacanthus TaxID=80966 RepID=UPI002233EF8A|nr:tripartite motif-containing protein 16-like [Acanthochromis polyacanthus]